MTQTQKINNITFVIHPTPYGDFDILAIGDCSLLYTLVKKCEHFHLIKKSKFGGMPLIVMDTFDTLRDAITTLKLYKREYIQDISCKT